MANYSRIKYNPSVIADAIEQIPAAEVSIPDSSVESNDIISLDGAKLTGNIDATKLLGNLPAIDGSSLTGISSGGFAGLGNPAGYSHRQAQSATPNPFPVTVFNVSPPAGSTSANPGICIIHWQRSISDNKGTIDGSSLTGLSNVFDGRGRAFSSTLFNGGDNKDQSTQLTLTGNYVSGTNVEFILNFRNSNSGGATTLSGNSHLVFIR